MPSSCTSERALLTAAGTNGAPMIRHRRFLILASLLVIVSGETFAQSAWNVSEVRPLEEQIPDIIPARAAQMAVLSPDGTMVAWFGRARGPDGLTPRGVCIFTFADEQTNCVVAPENFEGEPNALVWSPNSAMLAFTEQPFENEMDIWIYALETQRYVNLTDDGATGSDNDVGSSDGQPIPEDYLPVWSPDGQNLYFIRSGYWNGRVLTTSVFRLSADPDKLGIAVPEETHDLSDQASANFLAFAFAFEPAHPYAISSDGRQHALLWWARDFTDRLKETSSLLLIDADNPFVRRIIFGFELRASIPLGSNAFFVPYDIQWTPDGHGLVALAGNHAETEGLQRQIPYDTAFYIDAATSEITPLVDYSAYTDVDFDRLDSRDHSANFYGPVDAIVTPDSSVMISMHIEPIVPRLAILSTALPPNDSTPTILYEALCELCGTDGGHARHYATSMSADGKVLMGGYLFVLARE